MFTIKDIKHQFMAYRNGIVADILRKAGHPFGIIFGVQLPQLRQIASEIKMDTPDLQARKKLAEDLLADVDVRESRIVAFDIFPAEDIEYDEARQLCNTIRSREEADLLPFLLLKNTPYIGRLIADPAISGEYSEYLKESLNRYL